MSGDIHRQGIDAAEKAILACECFIGGTGTAEALARAAITAYLRTTPIRDIYTSRDIALATLKAIRRRLSGGTRNLVPDLQALIAGGPDAR